MRLTVYDTQDVAPVEQFAYWNDAICDTFTALECERASRAPFSRIGYRGSVESLDLGKVRLSLVRCDESNVEHSSFQVAKSDEEVNLLHLQTKGASLNIQNGREAFLSGGDFTLCDSTQPYAVRFSRPIEMLVLRLPKDVLGSQLQINENVYGHHFQRSDQHGFAKLVADSIFSIWENRYAVTTAAHASSVADSIVSLLSGHIGAYEVFAQPLERNPRIGLFENVRLVVSRMLQNPDLSPDLVALTMRISKRYLRQICAERGTTCSRYIMDRRLQAAQSMLTDPRYSHLKVIDIAFQTGFKAGAHFARVFKERYGCTPTEFRNSPGGN